MYTNAGMGYCNDVVLVFVRLLLSLISTRTSTASGASVLSKGMQSIPLLQVRASTRILPGNRRQSLHVYAGA